MKKQIRLMNYINLIAKEAHVAYRKLLRNGVSTYEVNDLIHDGVVQFYYLVRNRYDSKKGALSTLLTIMLRHYYTNLLHKETKRVHVSYEDLDFAFGYTPRIDDMIHITELDSMLNASARKVFRCILGADKEYTSWIEKKDWAKVKLGVGYRVRSQKKLIEQFVGRDISLELTEISHLVGWDGAAVNNHGGLSWS